MTSNDNYGAFHVFDMKLIKEKDIFQVLQNDVIESLEYQDKDGDEEDDMFDRYVHGPHLVDDSFEYQRENKSISVISEATNSTSRKNERCEMSEAVTTKKF